MAQKIIIITGTPGAGKTTVLNETLKKFSPDNVQIVNYGDIMLEIAKKFKIFKVKEWC